MNLRRVRLVHRVGFDQEKSLKNRVDYAATKGAGLCSREAERLRLSKNRGQSSRNKPCEVKRTHVTQC